MRFIQPLSLPKGKIGVLNGQRNQWVLAALPERFIQQHELTVEYALRPSVRNDVMEIAQQDVITFAHFHELHA